MCERGSMIVAMRTSASSIGKMATISRAQTSLVHGPRCEEAHKRNPRDQRG